MQDVHEDRSIQIPVRSTTEQFDSIPEYHAGWDKWIAENAVRGVPRHKLRTVMYRKGFDRKFVDQRLSDILSHPLLKVATHWADRYHKFSSLLNTLSHLQDSQFHAEPVDTVDHLDAADFYSTYVVRNNPVLVKGLVAKWPAVDRWSGEYFLDRLGDVSIDVSDHRDADPKFEDNFPSHVATVFLSEFVRRVRAGPSNNCYVCAKHNFLAIPEAATLLDDFSYPDGYLDNTMPKSKASLWWGPERTWTPFHHDASNNLFCQVKGIKLLHLVAPVHLPRLYNNRACFSDVDPREINFDRFPEMRGVPIKQAVVNAGDALLIPVGWWHCVEALEESISLSLCNYKLPRNANVWSWR